MRQAGCQESPRRLGKGLAIPDDVTELMFLDGLTTKDSVTGISGRGVGLAAIRATCRRLGGDTVIESVPGEGTILTAHVHAAVLDVVHSKAS